MSRRKLYAYYYPAHHRSRSGWFEWDLVRDARPWFDGHQKPDVPLWGELDDSLPSTFIRQARAAKAAGIDGFVIDTWWRPDGATLYAETLERAVLPAYAAGDVPEGFDFGLLWCPVWPRVSLPVGMEASSVATGIDRLFPFKAEDLLRLLDALRPYLTHERAIRIGGRPLLSFFHAWRLRAQLGAGLPDALDAMRAWGAREGPGALFLAGCVNQAAEADLLDSKGFDALTSYVWWPDWNGPARQDYPALAVARRLDHDALRSARPRRETPLRMRREKPPDRAVRIRGRVLRDEAHRGVEDDRPALSDHQRRVGLELGKHVFFRVIRVEREEVFSRAADDLRHAFDDLRIGRVAFEDRDSTRERMRRERARDVRPQVLLDGDDVALPEELEHRGVEERAAAFEKRSSTRPSRAGTSSRCQRWTWCEMTKRGGGDIDRPGEGSRLCAGSATSSSLSRSTRCSRIQGRVSG